MRTVITGPRVARNRQVGMVITGTTTSSRSFTAPCPRIPGNRQRSSRVLKSLSMVSWGTLWQVIHLGNSKQWSVSQISDYMYLKQFHLWKPRVYDLYFTLQWEWNPWLMKMNLFFWKIVKSLQYISITNTCNEDIFVNQTINLSCDNRVLWFYTMFSNPLQKLFPK